MCLVLCNFIVNVRSSDHHHSQYKERFHHKMGICFYIVVQSLSHVHPWTAAGRAFTVLFCLPEFCSKSGLLVSDTIQPSHPLSPPSPPALKSFPALGSFPVSQLFTSGGQSIGASASASVLPMNIQGWFPLGLTDLISLQSKGLSRVFSSTIQKPQFFGTQPS